MAGVIVIKSESFTVMHLVQPQAAPIRVSASCPKLVTVMAVGNVVTPWKAARNVSEKRSGTALQQPVLTVAFIVAVIGTYKVVPTIRGVPVVYVTVACGCAVGPTRKR